MSSRAERILYQSSVVAPSRSGLTLGLWVLLSASIAAWLPRQAGAEVRRDFDDDFFGDGFESGDTSAWTRTVR